MFAKALLPELDHELATTRKILEIVPEDRVSFKPHPKSFDLGSLAMHVANLTYWGATVMKETEFDAASSGTRRTWESTAALLTFFDAHAKELREAIATAEDDAFRVPWTLRAGERVIFTLPRIATLRGFVMNHLIHHRGQLSVYLRMNDVPLPSIYGPTADMP